MSLTHYAQLDDPELSECALCGVQEPTSHMLWNVDGLVCDVCMFDEPEEERPALRDAWVRLGWACGALVFALAAHTREVHSFSYGVDGTSFSTVETGLDWAGLPLSALALVLGLKAAAAWWRAEPGLAGRKALLRGRVVIGLLLVPVMVVAGLRFADSLPSTVTETQDWSTR